MPDFRPVPGEILEAARQVEDWMAANNCTRLRGLSAQADIANLRAENAHLKNALALADALRNAERNLPL
jgi:cell wall assembly regulator SMI1